MLISVLIVILGVSLLYFYRKFKESENAYYKLHLEYIELMNANKILKQNNYNDDYLDSINENTLIMDKNIINYLINEIPDNKEESHEERKEECKQEECQEEENKEEFRQDENSIIDINNLQDINSLNYMKFKI